MAVLRTSAHRYLVVGVANTLLDLPDAPRTIH